MIGPIRRPKTIAVCAARVRRWLCVLLVAVTTASVIFGCASAVVPPAKPRDPVTVYLLQTGIHTGLIFPEADGTHTEFGYGEWSWYAKNETGIGRAIEAALWETQGTLGKRRVKIADDGTLAGVALSPVNVARDRMISLRDRLHADHAAHADLAVFNPVTGMTYVPIDAPFSMFFNCADATANWLRALGCDVAHALLRVGLYIATRVRPPSHSEN